MAPDEKDVKVDGGEDEEGNGDEEEEDVPGIENKGGDVAFLLQIAEDERSSLKKYNNDNADASPDPSLHLIPRGKAQATLNRGFGFEILLG